MAENETEQLSSKFFDILKDTDQTKNANIQASCDNLANSIININKELNSETATAYLNEIEKINKEIPDFKEKKLAQMLTVIKDTLPSIQNPDVKEILDIPLIEYLAEKQSKEYNQEKENFEKREKVVPKAVSDLIRDRRVANVQEFKKEADKSEGVSGGYIAYEQATHNTFMLKRFYKKGADVETTQQWMDRNDAVRELIGGNMYEQLLYNRAPKEELVTGYANSKLPDFVSKILYVRSKFLENSEHLGEVLEQTKTPKLSGFEKAIAASHILGESDYHTQNLMVQNNNTVVKIDHGRSFMNFNKDFTSMLKDANEKFERFGYNENIEKGQLTFNVKEYSKSLNQMLNQLDNNQIDNIIDQKVDELVKEQKEYRSIDPLKYILSRNQVAISKSEKEFLNQAINLGIKNNFDESYKENTRFKDDI
ncbi:MAG TPA: phosphatidylinositol 4-kinase [Rickettsia endosymbiont of Bembidion lapponicum]|nr:phosphatidylinositol 4-kinase [Rickettsia endosymbiont of Bembidion lapponicum]